MAKQRRRKNIVRVIFLNGLESFREIKLVRLEDGSEVYPQAFITGKPDIATCVKVWIDEKLFYYLEQSGKMIIYRELNP